MVSREDRPQPLPDCGYLVADRNGAIMIAPVPGAVAAKPGSATRPFFRIQPEVVNKQGEPVPAGTEACW